MAISVESHPRPLLLLLFVRDALHPAPPAGESRLPPGVPRAIWERRWMSLWERVWGWYGPGPLLIPGTGRVRCFASGSVMDTELGARFWCTRSGTAGVDEAAFEIWLAGHLGGAGLPDFGAVQPVLVAAWERGLCTIIELPLTGHYALRLGPSHLVASTETLRESVALHRALAGWISRG